MPDMKDEEYNSKSDLVKRLEISSMTCPEKIEFIGVWDRNSLKFLLLTRSNGEHWIGTVRFRDELNQKDYTAEYKLGAVVEPSVSGEEPKANYKTELFLEPRFGSDAPRDLQMFSAYQDLTLKMQRYVDDHPIMCGGKQMNLLKVMCFPAKEILTAHFPHFDWEVNT